MMSIVRRFIAVFAALGMVLLVLPVRSEAAQVDGASFAGSLHSMATTATIPPPEIPTFTLPDLTPEIPTFTLPDFTPEIPYITLPDLTPEIPAFTPPDFTPEIPTIPLPNLTPEIPTFTPPQIPPVTITPIPLPTLPTTLAQSLAYIHDIPTATQAVLETIQALTPAELQIGVVELFADHAITRAAEITINEATITLSASTLIPYEQTAQSARAAIEAMLLAENYTLSRDLSTGVGLHIPNATDINITLDPSAAATGINNIRIRTDNFEIGLTHNFLTGDLATTPLTITASSTSPLELGFDRSLTEPIRIAAPPLAGPTTYQTFVDASGVAVGGLLNPATGLLETRITSSGRFVVVENRVDFGDIAHLSAQAQQAIRTLASQGLVNGTAPNRFSPDATLNRAEMAALIMRMLGQYDPSADGGFRDVSRASWFFGAAGSASRHGIMHGTGGGNFSPSVTLPRDQLTAIASRVLRSRMNYRLPANPENYTAHFADRDSFFGWSVPEIALAVREGLHTPRADGTFRPHDAMTRSDAAIMLYRLYRRIW